MKRDLHLVRAIGFAVEAATQSLSSTAIVIDGYRPEAIAYHAVLMCEAGLLLAEDASELAAGVPELMIHRLTWAGHEFIDAARDDSSWNSVKRWAGAVTLATLTWGLQELARRTMAQQLPE